LGLKSVYYSAALWSVDSENVEIERTAKGSRNGRYPLYRTEGKYTYTVLICREAERERERERDGGERGGEREREFELQVVTYKCGESV
jgi:hypothetical protein